VLAIVGFTLLFPNQAHEAYSVLAFPVFFAASQMRTTVATRITTVAIAADAITLALTEPGVTLFIHTLFVAPGLIFMALLLVMAMNRQERLNAALHCQAAVDSLTGLVTRRVFDECSTSPCGTRWPRHPTRKARS
jgi:hypothetical protein